MNIRRAKLEDAGGIAKVHVDSWRTTYAKIIPEAFLKGLSYEKREVLWQANLKRIDNIVFVAENENGGIIGFADTSKRETNHEPNSIDLTSIYLLQEYQGLGIGKKLMETLFKYYLQCGYEKVFVDVLADNKTRHFYEHYGAKFLKQEKIVIGGKSIMESFYVWNSVEDVLKRL